MECSLYIEPIFCLAIPLSVALGCCYEHRCANQDLAFLLECKQDQWIFGNFMFTISLEGLPVCIPPTMQKSSFLHILTNAF